MKAFILVACLLSLAAATLPALKDDEYDFLFTKWASQHGKTYATTQERAQRLAVFTSNLNYIRAHQAKSPRSYDLKMNEFGDLTNEEFVSQYTGYTPMDRSYLRSQNEEELSPVDVPTDWDWRAQNKVTPIKDQGQCGSCWAFSAVGSIESGYAIDNNVAATVTVSEQQLVDCSGAEGNEGCNGGLMDSAFEYVIKNGGLCTESAYPYKAVDGTCKKTCTKTLTISGYTDVKPNNSTALLNAVATRPVSIAVDAAGSDWQFYSGGVINDKGCGTSLDHGVLLVGYSQSSSPKYWIVKNSWGTSWGNKGYIYIANDGANDAGICGINMDPSYATGVKKIGSKRHAHHN